MSGEGGRVVSWEGGKRGKRGKRGKIVRRQGWRGWRAVTWQVGWGGGRW